MQATERGFLSGALALPAAQLDSIPNRAFADLVVCVHQAKIHETSLQEMLQPYVADAATPCMQWRLQPHACSGGCNPMHAVEAATPRSRRLHTHVVEAAAPRGRGCHPTRCSHLLALQGAAPAELLEIVAPAFRVEDELRCVQETLGRDFDLRAVRSSISAERCWDLFSTHVDKLQRVEARLAEAVQKADHSRARKREQVTEVVHTLLGTLGDEKRHAGRLLGTPVASRLEGLDPRLLKSELMRLIEARHDEGPPAAKRARLEAGGHGHGAAEAGEGAAASVHGAVPGAGEAGPSDACGLGEQWLIKLDELKLIKRVGVGSSGTTYEARWRGASVAVKVAGHGVTKLAEFRAEVAALTQLRHPHIVQHCSAGQTGPAWLAAAYCDHPEARLLARGHPPGPERGGLAALSA